MAKSWWSGAQCLALVVAIALLSALAVLAPGEPAAAQAESDDVVVEPEPAEPEPQPAEPEESEPLPPAPAEPEPAAVQPGGGAQPDEGDAAPEPLPADGVNALPATVGDRVWIDLDRNGFQDPGEPGMPFLDVEIWRSTEFGTLTQYVTETVTDAEGAWSISVPPGSYAARILVHGKSVGVTVPDTVDLVLGEIESERLDSDAYEFGEDFALTEPFTLASGEVQTDIDFGLDPTFSSGRASVRGSVWHDVDRNSMRDPLERGLADVRVSLVDVANDLIVAETRTDFSGFYSFGVPRVGTYEVEVDSSPNLLLTPIQGDNQVGLDGRSEPVTLDFWNSSAVVSAGLVVAAGDVQGTVFVDANGNGVRDTTDPPAVSVVIELQGAFGNRIARTDESGDYRFEVVPAGDDYRVLMSAPPGDEWTLTDVGDDAADSDVDSNGESASFSVVDGSVTTIDGGFYTPVELAIASLEVPPPGWSATIEIEGEELPWDLEQIARVFPPGTTVEVSQRLAPVAQWSVDGIVCNGGELQEVTSDAPGVWTAEITPLVDTDCVFQNRWLETTRVYGIVFEDKSHNSRRDTGDPGLAGVAVELRSVADELLATTATDVDGRYSLEAPGAGLYSVKVIAPSDMRFAWMNFGDESIDSDVDLSGEAQVTLADGEAVQIDAGLLRDVTIEGIFWLDENEDGQRGDDEPPVADVFVGVREVTTRSVHSTTYTNADGRYSFDRIPPGVYEVLVSRGSQGVRFTQQGVGDDATDSDFFSVGVSEQIEVFSGTGQIDGGLLPSVTIEVNVTDPAGLGFESPEVQIGIHREQIGRSPQTFAVVPMSVNVLEAWFQPVDDWEVTGLDCTGPATVEWSDRGDGYSVASIDVGAAGVVACAYQVTHLPTRPVDVTLVVEGPADAPPVLVEARWGHITDEDSNSPFSAALVPGRSQTLSLEPRLLGWGPELSIPLVPAGWSATFECDARIGVEAQSSAASTAYRLDLLAIAGESATCTITMVETAPAIVQWTNTHEGASTPAINLSLNLRTVSAIATASGSAAVPVVPGSVDVYLRVDPQSAVLESLVCTVDGVTVEASSIFEGRSAGVTVEDAAPGVTVTCISSTSDPTTAQLTLITDGNGTANVTINASYSPTQFVDVVDQVTIDIPRDFAWVDIDVGPSRRFLEVQCDRFIRRQPVDTVGFFELDMTAGDTTCTIVTSSEPNPPIGVELIPVFAGDEGPPPILAIRETYYAAAEPWSLDGVRREHYLGVLAGTSAVDGFITYFELPVGWRVGETTCTGLADPFTGRSALTVDLELVDPGSEIVCEVAIEQVTTGTTVTLQAEWEGAAPQPLPFGFSGSIPQVLAPGEQVSFFIDTTYTFSVYPIPGYAFMAFDCGNGAGRVTVQGDAVAQLSWPFSEEPPDSFNCVVTVAPVAPVELAISTEVEGVLGNGELRFMLEADGFRETVVIDGADTVRVAVPTGTLDLTAELPVTLRNIDVECDRIYGAAIDGAEIELDLRSGETVECTFTNEMVSQDVGVSGDANCDGFVDIIDALVIAQFEALVRSSGAACPLGNAATELFTGAADFDGSGRVDILDALQVAQCTVGLPAPACPGAAAVEPQ